MILNFSVQNWMSFREKCTFSMLASRQRKHRERLPYIKRYHHKVLPIATIYGGNASGKTNFFKALNFCKKLVIEGTHPDSEILINTFRLDDQSPKEPVTFSLEILINEVVYCFSFKTTRYEILEEKLVEVTPSGVEKILYQRLTDSISFRDLKTSDQEKQFLDFVLKSTRKNQLFLTQSIHQNMAYFRPIYDWFKDRLQLIAPDSRFGPFERFFNETHTLYGQMNELLQQLDTGINELGEQVIPFENALPEPLKELLHKQIPEGDSFRLHKERLIVSKKNGDLITQKLVSYHLSTDGRQDKIPFDLAEESDGSQRIIELLPAFLDLSQPTSQTVCIIDELDRSLHAKLTRTILEFYLKSCSSETRSQLITTTHDILLMNQNLLRRDEMWLAERNHYGASELISLEHYKSLNSTEDLQGLYLQGLMGGIPKILHGHVLHDILVDASVKKSVS